MSLFAEMKGLSLLQNASTGIKLPMNHIKGLPASAGPFQLGENGLIRSRKSTLFTLGGADLQAWSCHFPFTLSSAQESPPLARNGSFEGKQPPEKERCDCPSPSTLSFLH